MQISRISRRALWKLLAAVRGEPADGERAPLLGQAALRLHEQAEPGRVDELAVGEVDQHRDGRRAEGLAEHRAQLRRRALIELPADAHRMQAVSRLGRDPEGCVQEVLLFRFSLPYGLVRLLQVVSG